MGSVKSFFKQQSIHVENKKRGFLGVIWNVESFSSLWRPSTSGSHGFIESE